MTDENEQHDTRAEIFECVCDLVEELQSEGACPCCVDAVLLMLAIGRGGCADAIRSLSPIAIFELRQAITEAAAERL